MEPSPSNVPAYQPAELIRPSRGETLALIALLSGLFLLQLLTYRQYPVVWCDEVSFSEPAINFVQHGTFTTTVWQHQPPDTFPTINCPLYSMALAPWLSLAGTSLLAVRSFNYGLMVLAAALLWVISWRYALVRSQHWRLLLVVLFFSGYGMSFAYRCARPDILALVILLALALSLSIPQPTLRGVAVVALGAACVWVGMQVALYAALAFGLAWLLLGVVSWRQLVLLASGFLLGAATLALFLSYHGVLQYLIPIVLGMSGKHYAHDEAVSLPNAVSRILQKTLFAYPDDFSTVILAGAATLLLVLGWRAWPPSDRRWVAACLLLIAAVPLVFNIVGHYAFYYSYMLFVPAILAFTGLAALIARRNPVPHPPWVHAFIFLALTAAVFLGLPLRLGMAVGFARFESPHRVSEALSTQLRPDDVVFAEYVVFFAVKPLVRRVYDPWSSAETMPFHIPGRTFTEHEKQQVSALVIRPAQLAHYAAIFGGDWTPQGVPFGDSNDIAAVRRVPVLGPWLVRHFSQPQTDRFQVQIFRRSGPNS